MGPIIVQDGEEQENDDDDQDDKQDSGDGQDDQELNIVGGGQQIEEEDIPTEQDMINQQLTQEQIEQMLQLKQQQEAQQ